MEASERVPSEWTKISDGMSVRREGDRVRVCRATHELDENEEVYALGVDYTELQRTIEIHFGVWLEGMRNAEGAEPSDDGQPHETWTHEFSDTQPTHRIEFRAGHNAPDTQEPESVYLVHLHEDDAQEDEWPAYSHAEWDGCEAADWGVFNGEWLFQRQVTPGGQVGTVSVTEL